MRRNLVMPIRNLFQRGDPSLQQTQEIKSIGQGTLNFAQQFKPHALGPANARQLVMTDSTYATPSDNYFSYLAKRKQEEEDVEGLKERYVWNQIGVSGVIPSYYNLQSGKFEIQNLSEQDIQTLVQSTDIQQEQMDPFLKARQEALHLLHLQQLNEGLPASLDKNTSQKHSKKDYDKLKAMTMSSIFENLKEETEKRKFEDDFTQLNEVVKIEKKKNLAQKKKKEQIQKAKEIKKMLENPQDIDYDKAIQLYEELPLEAKKLSVRDKKRLRRLKQKAESENLDVEAGEKTVEESTTQQQQTEQSQSEVIQQEKTEVQAQPRAEEDERSIRIEMGDQQQSDDNIDSLIK